MKIKKIWKSAFLLTLIPGSLLGSVALISCGSKSTPPKVSAWDDFLAAAKAEDAINIVQVSNPKGWSDATANQLWRSSFTPDKGNKIINVNIVRTVDKTIKSNADFKIEFKNKDYVVDDWICIKTPVNNFTWEQFVSAVQTSKPADFLAAAKKSPNYKTKFIWAGDSSQQTWLNDDKAEFDVYGGLAGAPPDADGLNLMHGNPTDTAAINKTAATITVVISKTNRAGLFDADPIKIIYHYTGSLFDIDIATFSKTVQLQSRAKYLSVIDSKDYIKSMIENPISNSDWLTFATHYWSLVTDNKHGITLDTWTADRIGFNYIGLGWKFKLLPGYQKDIPIKDTKGTEIGLQYCIKVEFTITGSQHNPWDLTFTNNFMYADSHNKNITNTPFDFNWTCVAYSKPDSFA